jgi:hypothetical protein
VKRQYLGCAGLVANGINTVHLSYVRERTGHGLIGARQWIPQEHIADPVKSLVMGLPPDLGFRTKGQLAIDICAGAYADGLAFDFACGDEVYGSCTQLREFLEGQEQAYILRVASNFTLTLAAETKLTWAQAAGRLLKHKRRWEARSAGKGSKGERWYAWTWLATASPRHHLLVRRHLKTGELAFHYCYVPEGQRPRSYRRRCSPTQDDSPPGVISRSGRRGWPVGEERTRSAGDQGRVRSAGAAGGRTAGCAGEGRPGPGDTASRLTGSGVRVGIYVLKFRIHPAFPVRFLRAHHGPHLGELIGIRHVRLAARLVAGVSRRRYAVSHGQILLQKPRTDQTRSA